MQINNVIIGKSTLEKMTNDSVFRKKSNEGY